MDRVHIEIRIQFDNAAFLDTLVSAPNDLVHVWKALRLETAIHTSNMYLFDEHYKIRKYHTTSEILQEFVTARLALYARRKEHL